MKRLKIFVPMITLLFIAGCQTNSAPPERLQPDPRPEVKIEYPTLSLNRATSYDILIDIKANDYIGNYYVGAIDKATFDDQTGEIKGDTLAFAEVLMAAEVNFGTDLSSPDGVAIFSGDNSEVSVAELWFWQKSFTRETPYVIVAFGFDAETKEPTSEISLLEASTTDIIVDENYAIETSITEIGDNTASVTWTPTEEGIPYFSELIRVEDIADMTDEQIMMDAEARLGDKIAWNITDIKATTNYIDLNPGTEYIAISCAYDQQGSGVLSKLFKSEVVMTTGERVDEVEIPTAITISSTEFGTITLSGATDLSFDYTITPIDSEMSYVVYKLAASYYETLADQEAIILDTYDTFELEASLYGGTFTTVLNNYVRVGEQSGTWTDLVIPSTEYVVYAFGIDLKTLQPTTEVMTARITTEAGELPPPPPPPPASPRL